MLWMKSGLGGSFRSPLGQECWGAPLGKWAGVPARPCDGLPGAASRLRVPGSQTGRFLAGLLSLQVSGEALVGEDV